MEYVDQDSQDYPCGANEESEQADRFWRDEDDEDMGEGKVLARLPRRERNCCKAMLADCRKFLCSPVIKYWYNSISCLIFLMLYSYIMLCQFNSGLSGPEIILVVWVVALYTEEFSQIKSEWYLSWQRRLRSWICDYWNQMDLIALVTFVVGVGLKSTSFGFGPARIILALNLMFLYIRLGLQFFTAHKHVGPMLVMIKYMMIDLSYFLRILLVFLIAYGVASQAILFPNVTDPVDIVTGVFVKGYFQIYGELFLDRMHGDDMCSTNKTLIASGVPRCPEYPWVGVALLAGHMMLSNVLLLNILIAMFSNTFERVSQHSGIYWKMQQYELVMEYIRRPVLVPPLNIIYLPYLIISAIMSLDKERRLKNSVGVSSHEWSKQKEKELRQFEERAFQKYAAEKEHQDSHTITLEELNKRISELSAKLELALGEAKDE